MPAGTNKTRSGGWRRRALTAHCGVMGLNTMTKKSPYRHLVHLAPFRPQSITFFTAATFDRKRILDNEIAHATLRSIWKKSGEINGWYVVDYLLMPDHIHFFAQSAMESDPMGKWVKMWKSTSAREWIKKGASSVPIWQDEYFDHYLRSGESYSQKWEYVENNPVRAGLVTNPEEWPFKGCIFRLNIVEM